MIIDVAKLKSSDFRSWLKLFHAYAEFYKVSLTEDGIKTTWRWLMDTDHEVRGIGAWADNELVGFAHYRSMPSPLRGSYVGFLDDLYVRPGDRGTGAAEALICSVRQAAESEKWTVVRWITQDNNYRARALYDKVADKTDWNMYELRIE